MSKLPVSEVFGPTLQGEGFLAGLRTMFVRFGYCDGAGGDAGWCKWCDSLHSVNPQFKKNWKLMEEKEITDELYRLGRWCQQVTLSGGNPALHNLESLIDSLNFFGYTVNIETQGTIWRDWMGKLDLLTVSPKPPSAGADPDDNLMRFASFISHLRQVEDPPAVCVKVPVDVSGRQFRDDYKFALSVFDLVDGITEVYIENYLSIVTYPEDTAETLLAKYRGLAEAVAQDRMTEDVHVLPQLHVLLWGHKKGV